MSLVTPMLDCETSVTSETTLAWYAVQTRSRHEKLVREQLAKYHIEPFLPSVARISQWKDRKKKIEFPLFAGYCFARFALAECRYTVLQLPGVVRLVGLHGRPEVVPDEEIESLRLLLTQAMPHSEHSYVQDGGLVEVIRGPLRGAKGRVIRHARNCRLVLSISLIQRAVSVEIAESDIVPVQTIPRIALL